MKLKFLQKIAVTGALFILCVSTAPIAFAQNCVNGRTDTGQACFTGPAISNVPNTAPTNNSGCPNGGTINANGVCNLGYTPLEPIPGIVPVNGTTYDLTSPGGFAKFINAIFTILITAGALIAVVSLTIGGIQYMTASSIGNKTQGLDRAKAAVYGLLLIAATYLILNTINPQLLNFNFIACQGGGNSTVCTSAATVNPTSPAASTANTDTPAANAAIQALNNAKPDPTICSDAAFAGGTTNVPTSLSNVGTGLTQLARVASDALFQNNVFSPTPLVTQMSNLGSASYNQLIAADQALVARCQAAGITPS